MLQALIFKEATTDRTAHLLLVLSLACIITMEECNLQVIYNRHQKNKFKTLLNIQKFHRPPHTEIACSDKLSTK